MSLLKYPLKGEKEALNQREMLKYQLVVATFMRFLISMIAALLKAKVINL